MLSSQNFAYIKEAWEGFAAVTTDLQTCLTEERSALISLDIDRIVQSNLRKESLLGKLRRTRREFRTLLRSLAGVESMEGLSPVLESEENRREWVKLLANWNQQWSDVAKLCETNRKFTLHSLRNLGSLVENLKRLFGENPLYSRSGGKLDSSTQGKVVEAVY